MYIRQIRREDDLAALRPHDAVCDRKKAMQVVIAVAARERQMIGILDDERVVRAGDELDEDYGEALLPSGSAGRFIRRSNVCHLGSECRLSRRGSVFT